MAARGQKTKDNIVSLLVNLLPNNTFFNGKELRIAALEDGEEVQIKVTLTAAKENVNHGEIKVEALKEISPEPAPEEIALVKDLLEALKR